MRRINYRAYEPLVRYRDRVLLKENRFYARRHATGRYTYACPGHAAHKPSGRQPVGMFERWHKRGHKAYGVYWRHHQA